MNRPAPRDVEPLPPHSAEGEACYLSALMLSGDNPAPWGDPLPPAAFFIDAHRTLYGVLLDLHGRGPVDAVILRDELERRGLLKEIGGAPFLMTLLNAVPDPGNHAAYRRIVADAHLRRMMLVQADALRALALAPPRNGDARELAAAAGANLLRLSAPAEPREAPAPADDYKPFPLDVLPGVAREFAEHGASAINCDPAFIALPLLAVLAASIGNSRRLRAKHGWSEPCPLWTVPVSPSGTGKSPAFAKALGPLFRRQAKLLGEHAQAMADYRAALKAWKATPKFEREGDEPEAPAACAHLYVGDTTTEALAVRLSESPRGLLVAVDELSGWFGSWNQYKHGGSDRESYLAFYDAGAAKIDRKSAMPPTIYVPRAFVAITGGVQPGILRRVLTSELHECGLAARFLYAMPPVRPVTWTEAEISGHLEADLDAVVGRLLDLQMQSGEYGPMPVDLPLSDAARDRWVEFFNEHGEEQAALGDERLSAVWAKHRGAALRLALVLHLTSWAAAVDGGFVDVDAVDSTSMEGGIILARWFGNEAKRLYSVLGEGAGEREQRELMEYIRGVGGRVTVRELRHKRRKYRNDPDAAERALSELVTAGMGTWEYPAPGSKGGHPSRVFTLCLQCQRNHNPDSSAMGGGIVAQDGGFVDTCPAEAGAGPDLPDVPDAPDLPAEPEHGAELLELPSGELVELPRKGAA